MVSSFKDFYDQNDKQVQHRHQHPVIRDPSTRKHTYTVPRYIRPKQSPKKYNDFKKSPNQEMSQALTNHDKAKLQADFNVKDLPVGKVKGLKRTGVGMVKMPSGHVKLIKTK